MFASSAPYYDLLYSFKDYGQEARRIAAVIAAEHPAAGSVLDVACGTAEHLRHLAGSFAVAGLDIEPEFVAIARHKVPAARFWTADMADFELGERFDVVQCLFSAIGYLMRPERVVRTLECFGRHLNDDGIVLVEPWFTPDRWTTGLQQMLTVEQPDLRICRMSVSARDGATSIAHFHYLVGDADGVRHFEETHALALYSHEEMMGFFRSAGFNVRHDPAGIAGRGLYIAKPVLS